MLFSVSVPAIFIGKDAFGTILGRGRGGAAEKEEREKKEVIYTSRPGPGTCLKAARAKRAPRGTMKAEGRESCGELMSLCATERFRLFSFGISDGRAYSMFHVATCAQRSSPKVSQVVPPML